MDQQDKLYFVASFLCALGAALLLISPGAVPAGAALTVMGALLLIPLWVSIARGTGQGPAPDPGGDPGADPPGGQFVEPPESLPKPPPPPPPPPYR